MHWTAYTWHGGTGLVTWSSRYHEWADVPDAIAYIDIYHGNNRRRLQGMDNYWIDLDAEHNIVGCGMVNDDENAELYEGLQMVAYAYADDAEYDVREMTLLDLKVMHAGVHMPDDIAQIHGLL